MDNILKEVLSVQDNVLENQDIVQVVGKQKFIEFLVSELRAYEEAMETLNVPEFRKDAPTKSQIAARNEKLATRTPIKKILDSIYFAFIICVSIGLGAIPIMAIVYALLFIIQLFLDDSSSISVFIDGNYWILFIIFSLILGTVSWILLYKGGKKTLKEDTEFNEQVELKQKKADALRINPDFIFFKENSKRILGSNYFNLTCLRKFLDYFNNGRCNTLLEAKNILERENELRAIRNEIDDVRRIASSALARSSYISSDSSSKTDKAIKSLNRQISEIKDRTGML